MKISLITSVVLTIITSCTNTSSTRSFIPGIYVNNSGSTHSVANDTLIIDYTESNNYVIHRKTGFNRTVNGQKGKRELATEEWQAIYDSGTRTLNETIKGKIITFYPESRKLMIRNREYKKIN